NQNLPSFVILTDAGEVLGGGKNWSSGFLPATYEGTLFRREGAPILDLAPPSTIGDEQQRGRLDLLKSLNRHYGDKRPQDSELDRLHGRRCLETDVPIAGLLTDLKARGLLDSTLVVWGGEFGRTPFNEKGNGRDHNPWGFTMWMAGGGMKKGAVIGRTDDLGLRAVERPTHVHDLHATILWCLGLDHVKVTYLHNGRSERPTIVSGDVVREALS